MRSVNSDNAMRGFPAPYTTMSPWHGCQERFVVHFKDHILTMGPGAPETTELLACLVCVILFLEASGVGLAEVGHENLSLKHDVESNLLTWIFCLTSKWGCKALSRFVYWETFHSEAGTNLKFQRKPQTLKPQHYQPFLRRR